MGRRYLSGDLVIGVDGGTESLRAGVFDLAGKPLGYVSVPYETRFPQPSWAEQDPEDWWQAMGSAVRRVLVETGTSPDRIAAICHDATSCTVVALDANGRALRPALIWMDVRAGEQAARVAGSGDPALKVNGAGHGPVSAEWMIPKALWLKDNEPDTLSRAATVCEFQDYLNLRLTGRRVASINNASIRWHYQHRDGGFQQPLLARLALEDLLDKWPREVLALGEVIGPVIDSAAAHLGLNRGTPVVQGGADAFIAMLGLGVIDPGALALITGSSHLHLGMSDRPFQGRGIWGTYADAVLPGLHVIEGGQTSTGSIVNWFRRLVGGGLDLETLGREAATLPPGAEGLIVLDHFQGNRTPHTDPNSRGVISGLTLKHGPAHVFRAIMEGVAFGTELILETMREHGYRPSHAAVCGGATRSPLWLQIHADVSGLPLDVTEVPDAPALGSAILAATGAGLHADIPSAVRAMVRVARRIEPDAGRHAVYREIYQSYRETYPVLAPVLHRQART